MTKKVKITADAVLRIIKGVLTDEDVNSVVSDENAPPEWIGKTVDEILNVEYYTFKHRPAETDTVVRRLMTENGEAGGLHATNRSFCLCSMGSIERLFSKDVDMVVLSATLEYYMQTNKIQLLEYLIENANIATSGLRIPVQFGEQTRKAVIVFDRPEVLDVQTAGAFGETANVEVSVDILFYPDVVSYADYTVSFQFTDKDGRQIETSVPLSSFSFVDTMTQKAVPRQREVGNINLSNAKSFVLVFDGYANPFIDHITDKALGLSEDNNEVYLMTVARSGTAYTHEVIIKDHQVTVNADTSNETHTLTLVKKGM